MTLSDLGLLERAYADALAREDARLEGARDALERARSAPADGASVKARAAAVRARMEAS